MVLICYYEHMGEQHLFQQLTKEDRITVILYRAGIGASALIVALGSYFTYRFPGNGNSPVDGIFNILLILLYGAVGLSVFFIHLYVSKFHSTLKKLYYVALLSLVALFVLGNGNAFDVFVQRSYGPLFLIPLSGCLGFITAKEAFCFKLTEGYLLAMIMPGYLLLLSAGAFTGKGAVYGSVLIAAMLIFFTARKIFMPIHYDIGDKSAYI
jgi:uncharacterized integral membrane protein